jgi:hypothetical protein
MAENLKILVSLQDRFSKPYGRIVKSIPSLRTVALGASAGVAALTGTLAAMVKMTASSEDRIQKLSDQLGVSTEFLSKMEVAADFSGVQVNTMNKAVQMLQVRIGEFGRDIGQAKDAFEALGIEVRKTDGELKTSEELMPELAERFNQMTNATERAEAASKIFGQRGMAMIQMCKEGRSGLEAMWKEAERFGVVVSGTAGKNAAQFEDSLSRVQLAVKGLRNSISDTLIPQLTPLIERFSSWIAQNRAMIASTTVEWLSNVAKMLIAVGNAFKWVDDNITDRVLDFFFGKRDTTKMDTLVTGLGELEKKLKAYQATAGAVARAGIVDEEYLAHLKQQIKLIEDTISMRKQEIATLRDVQKERAVAVAEAPTVPSFPPIEMPEITTPEIDIATPVERQISRINELWDQYYLDDRQRLDKWKSNQTAILEASGLDHTRLMLTKTKLDQVYDQQKAEFETREQELVQDKLARVQEMYNNQFLTQKEQLDVWYTDQLIRYAEHEEAMGQIKLIYLDRRKEIQEEEIQSTAAAHQSIMANSLTIAKAFGKKGFKIAQGLSIAQATMKAYEAFNNMLATTPGPPPLPQIAAAAALAAGLAQVAVIAKQKPPAAHQGLTNVPAEQTYLLQRNERVLSPVQNQDLTDFLDRVNETALGATISIEKFSILENATTFDALMNMDKDDMRDLIEEKMIEPMRELRLAGYKI